MVFTIKIFAIDTLSIYYLNTEIRTYIANT